MNLLKIVKFEDLNDQKIRDVFNLTDSNDDNTVDFKELTHILGL